MERAHQTIGDLLHTFKFGTAELDPEDPWGGILSAVILYLGEIECQTSHIYPSGVTYKNIGKT
eukprot:14236585-Ditylum_brightwellii.AAC.1